MAKFIQAKIFDISAGSAIVAWAAGGSALVLLVLF